MLKRKFNELIIELPEKEDIVVSADEGCQSPVDTMDNEIMVEIVHQVQIGEFTIVIISVE